jgi:hypothetical protein
MEEQKPQTPPTTNYNPMMDNVIERAYTQVESDANATQLSTAIPEPMASRRTISSRENPYDMLGGGGGNSGGNGGGGSRKSDVPPINPAMNDINDKDKKMGAEHLAKLVVDGYEQLHVFANKALQFPESKLRKLEAEGLVDLSIEIPYDYGKTITAGEFVKEFNEQNKDALTVSREFKKEVTPVLTRVMEKHGAGLTDEQYLGYLIFKDLAVKLVIGSQIRTTMNDMINVIKDYTLTMRESGQAPQPRPQASRPQEPQPEPQAPQPNFKQPQPQEFVYPQQEEFVEDYNFSTNEVVMNTRQQMDVPKTGKERLMETSDISKTYVCDECGMFASKVIDHSAGNFVLMTANIKTNNGLYLIPSGYIIIALSKSSSIS